jgi:calcineurin-like phosphoesterase family protein
LKIYLISDTHFNHANIATYCDRPEDFTETLIKRWAATVKPEDQIIHLGDVFIGKPEGWDAIWPRLTGKKTLIRGNHDRKRSSTWWMTHGFDSAVDSLILRRCWLTHEPATELPPGCILNIHGHLHNIWHGFEPHHGDVLKQSTKLNNTWQRLFAVEYTDYRPVEFEKFVAQPDKYQARGRIDRVNLE